VSGLNEPMNSATRLTFSKGLKMRGAGDSSVRKEPASSGSSRPPDL